MTVATVRLLATDPPMFDRVVAVGDGSTTIFTIPNTPLVATGAKVYVGGTLKTEGSDYTLDDALGILAFSAAPGLAVDIAVLYSFTLLSDADLQTLLDLTGGEDRLAAAQALDIIASSEVLIQKQITHLNLTTNGPAVAKSLRVHATELRRQVEEGEGAYDGLWDYAEVVVGAATAREKVWKEAFREQSL